MKAWIYSIVGIVILTVLLDLILEEGETKKYIKGIFSLLAVIVIASPVPKLLGGDYDFFNGENAETGITADETYLSSLNDRRLENYKTATEARLKESGYGDLAVNAVRDVTKSEYSLIKVVVTKKTGITDGDPNTYNIELIRTIVSEGMRAKKEVVLIDV